MITPSRSTMATKPGSEARTALFKASLSRSCSSAALRSTAVAKMPPRVCSRPISSARPGARRAEAAEADRRRYLAAHSQRDRQRRPQPDSLVVGALVDRLRQGCHAGHPRRRRARPVHPGRPPGERLFHLCVAPKCRHRVVPGHRMDHMQPGVVARHCHEAAAVQIEHLEQPPQTFLDLLLQRGQRADSRRSPTGRPPGSRT